MGLRYRTQSSEFAEASICEENIQAPFGFLDFLKKTIQITKVRDVALYPLGIRPDCGNGRLKFCLTSSCDENERSLLCKQLCGCRSYSAGAPSY